MKSHSIRLFLAAAMAIAFLSAPFTTGVLAAPGENPQPVLTGYLPGGSSRTVLEQGSDLQRIRFAAGATSAVVRGDLPANSSDRYVLRALGGQLMDVTLTAPAGVSLSVTTASGRALKAVTSGAAGFRGYLPRNGDYILTVASAGQRVSYSVNVSIPQRVSFVSGATSTTIQGHLDAHQSLDYILRAMAGQLMEINVTPENKTQLIIYGVDGTVLRSGMGEGSSFRGELPTSQDYIVTVRAGDQGVSFTMTVIIPRRIAFEPGAISSTLRGNVGANQSQYYVLRALKNQTMQVEVTPGNDVQLRIYGADGTVLKSGTGEGASFTGKLPGTQDYVLVVRAGANRARFTLQVTIK